MTRSGRPGLWNSSWTFPAIVAAFQLAFSLAFIGKPVHMDEAAYLAIARQALRNPLRPTHFEHFWAGMRLPASRMAPNPPAAGYLLAPAAAIGGTNVPVMRLVVIPFEIAGAVFLYLLAARFLQRPLVAVLAVLAGPGWCVTVPSFLPEKWMSAFGFAALYYAVHSETRRRDGGWWASAVLAALAALCKYTGAIFPLGCAAWYFARGTPTTRIAGWLAMALGPAAAHLASGAFDPERLQGIVALSTAAAGTCASHHVRAVLAFTTGCAPAVALWAWWSGTSRRRLAAVAALGAVLFLPAFDLAATTAADRLIGLALGAGAAAAIAASVLPGISEPGRPVWNTLAGLVLLLQTLAYWSVAARFSMFASAGIALALAARIERSQSSACARALAWIGFLANISIGIPAAITDAAYARASRDAARELAAPAVQVGRRTWFTGHWGYQYYMEEAGAQPLVAADGGWTQVRAGDVVVVPAVNTNVHRPEGRRRADVRIVEPKPPLPMLLMCGAGWRCQAGFHSSMYGFLPFSFSREPLDRFEIVEPR